MYRIGGHRRRLTLGAFPFVVSLADAREQAGDALKLVKHGIDPIEEQKRREEAEVQRILEGWTFEQLTKQFLEEYAKKLRSVLRGKTFFRPIPSAPIRKDQSEGTETGRRARVPRRHGQNQTGDGKQVPRLCSQDVQLGVVKRPGGVQSDIGNSPPRRRATA